jgi:hypothetical protein
MKACWKACRYSRAARAHRLAAGLTGLASLPAERNIKPPAASPDDAVCICVVLPDHLIQIIIRQPVLQAEAGAGRPKQAQCRRVSRQTQRSAHRRTETCSADGCAGMSWQGRRRQHGGHINSRTGRRAASCPFSLPRCSKLQQTPIASTLQRAGAHQPPQAPCTKPCQHPPWAPHPLHCPPAPEGPAAQPGQSRRCCRQAGRQAGS